MDTKELWSIKTKLKTSPPSAFDFCALSSHKWFASNKHNDWNCVLLKKRFLPRSVRPIAASVLSATRTLFFPGCYLRRKCHMIRRASSSLETEICTPQMRWAITWRQRLWAPSSTLNKLYHYFLNLILSLKTSELNQRVMMSAGRSLCRLIQSIKHIKTINYFKVPLEAVMWIAPHDIK